MGAASPPLEAVMFADGPRFRRLAFDDLPFWEAAEPKAALDVFSAMLDRARPVPGVTVEVWAAVRSRFTDPKEAAHKGLSETLWPRAGAVRATGRLVTLPHAAAERVVCR